MWWMWILIVAVCLLGTFGLAALLSGANDIVKHKGGRRGERH